MHENGPHPSPVGKQLSIPSASRLVSFKPPEICRSRRLVGPRLVQPPSVTKTRRRTNDNRQYHAVLDAFGDGDSAEIRNAIIYLMSLSVWRYSVKRGTPGLGSQVPRAFTVTDLQDYSCCICKEVSSGQHPCGSGGSFQSVPRSPGSRPVLRIRVRGKSNLLLSFEGCQALCERLMDRGIGVTAQYETFGCLG